MEIRFIKMEGLGNDYIFVDTRKCSFPSKLEEKLSNPEGGFKYLGPTYQIHSEWTIQVIPLFYLGVSIF